MVFKLGRDYYTKFDQLLILFCCIFFLADIVGLIFYITKVNQRSSQAPTSVKAAVNENKQPDTIQVIQTSVTSSFPYLQQPDIYGTTMQFTSYQLGLRFYYLTHWWRKTDSIEDKPTDVYISRSTNKVCLLYNIPSTSENCIGGQYLLFFKKDVKTPFKEIIEKDILNNNSKDCVVNTRKSGDKEIAEIVPLTDKCPETYSKMGVDRYFQYDSRFPDRFVFVSLGQQPIFGGTNNITWEKTLELF